MDETDGIRWLQEHLYRCYSPLLSQPWILDADVTVKPLYGKQEGAVAGYNPKKPGRPSHTSHTYMIANLRLILDGEVQAGNQSASCHSAPGLWALLERRPLQHWPAFVRGDCDGTQGHKGERCHYERSRTARAPLLVQTAPIGVGKKADFAAALPTRLGAGSRWLGSPLPRVKIKHLETITPRRIGPMQVIGQRRDRP